MNRLIKAVLKDARWENFLNFILGFWLMLVPWTFGNGFSSNMLNVVSWNFLLVGMIICSLALITLHKIKSWPLWIMLFWGSWLILSPWFLLYSHQLDLLINSIGCGLLIAGLSGLSIPVAEKPIYHRVAKVNLLYRHKI